MLGDKIVVREHHTRAAEGVYKLIRERVLNSPGRIAVTVAGESGSGKSEIATELSRLFSERDSFKSIVFHQDDYFIRPPKTNTEYREKGLKHVGVHEVKMELLDSHLKAAKNPEFSESGKIKKPLIDYDKDCILEESVDVENVKLLITEGTYTTSLKNADIKVFIDLNYKETKKHRQDRGRDKLDSYVEKILKKEHKIISSHKKCADIIIDSQYRALDAGV